MFHESKQFLVAEVPASLKKVVQSCFQIFELIGPRKNQADGRANVDDFFRDLDRVVLFLDLQLIVNIGELQVGVRKRCRHFSFH